MYEPIRAARWIDARIRGSSVIDALIDFDTQLYRWAGDEVINGLFISYQLQSADEDKTLLRRGGERLWSSELWLITVRKQTKSIDGELETVADELDLLFSSPDQSAYSGGVQSSVRVRPFMQPTFEKGLRYERVGGIYRLLVRVP